MATAQPPEQKGLWEELHVLRSEKQKGLQDVPNSFATRCAQLIKSNSTILEIGAWTGRDARHFARQKGCHVVACDFSQTAIDQLVEANQEAGLSDNITPVVTDMQSIPLEQLGHTYDGLYARSSLHLSDEQLYRLFDRLYPRLNEGALIMVAWKTRWDFRIDRSKVIGLNLLEDIDGHVRRLWSEKSVEDLQKRYGFQLLETFTGSIVRPDKKIGFIEVIGRK